MIVLGPVGGLRLVLATNWAGLTPGRFSVAEGYVVVHRNTPLARIGNIIINISFFAFGLTKANHLRVTDKKIVWTTLSN
ncbi:MAG: hypothetical protein DWQ04_29720 [Chloroflexi bacterium]|nr:MAG: hypothetical protein DWQ04_29720 [Chloroflexota bacterium]